MKKFKTGHPPALNAKISDFFSKVSDKTVQNDVSSNKRKSPIRGPKKISPDFKRARHENYEPSGSSQTNDCGISPTRNGVLQVNGNHVNSFQITTPEKCMRPSSSMHTPSSKKGSGSKSNKTPLGSKNGTPGKKLFEKSPKRLNEFNIQVLEDFMNISPSRSNVVVNVGHTRKKDTDVKNMRTPVKSGTKLNSTNMHSPCKSGKVLKYEEYQNEDIEILLNDQFNRALEELEDLKFNEPQYCKILQVTSQTTKFILKLKSVGNGNVGFCNIEEFWASKGCFEVGHKVYVSAEQNVNGEWIVNNKCGWVVYKPETLTPCTSVVGSLFCMRKSLLSDRFRGLDSGNRFMVIGALVHSLLQQTLKQKLKNIREIEVLLSKILKSSKTAKSLYDSNLTYAEIESELLTFVPRIKSFVDDYINPDIRTSVSNPENWKGKICNVEDIEENLWCPALGLKGKIDVTIKTESCIIPMEIKSGRASVSFEHRGQIVLYIMMMNKFGYKVSSGLLLYLREGVLKEIKTTPQEQRDLMILRNELVYYLTKKVTKDGDSMWHLPELPEPLSNNRACANCSYNVVCTSYLKSDECDLSKNKTLQGVQNNVTSHLTKTHLDYFVLWSTLLSLEGECNKDHKSVEDIYTIEPQKREAQGRCIINLKIMSVTPQHNDLFEHTFKKDISGDKTNLVTFGITENQYVVASTEKRPAVATGFVTEIAALTIKVALDRNLNQKYRGEVFHLDTYDSNINQTFNMSNLALLLENTPRGAELRNMIIDKVPPTFVTKLPSVVAKKGAPILKRLNHVQQKAILKALCANQYLLIKGMPGTGKSATIVALIQLLVELNKTVLITSHTHSAIDNICTRLQKFGVDFIRLGSENKIDPSLKPKSEASFIKNCTTPEQLEEVYNSFKVIAVTCLGSAHPLLSKRCVDFCIVDESTQVLQPSVFKALYAAKTFVLIGDPDQLAPVIRNQNALTAGMSESLFERLNNFEGTVTLNLNYRMNQTLTDLANVLTYKGELQTANELVANRTLYIPDLEEIEKMYLTHSWLRAALDTTLETAVRFIDTGPVWKLQKNSEPSISTSKLLDDNIDLQNCINLHEISIVSTIVKALLKAGVGSEDIGVIATYRAQVAQLSGSLENLTSNISTIDQFQGRDKNVVIYSCTKSSDPSKVSADRQKFELLEDRRRLTVAITRAKRKLIIVGDASTLQNYKPFSVILSALKGNIISFNSL